MSEIKDWLTTLNQATTYRELQSAVSQMFADATSTSDTTALSAAIDEAIRRIEQERVRDQAELESDTAEYDAFKQQQAGVLGWIRRKMPFTEARRQDLQHREAVDEQKAEVLADNFVIARAQMLKERLLPNDARRMGARLEEWQNRFLRQESIDGIREYGEVLRGLTETLNTASTFVKSIEVDIEGFAQANFSDKADRAQRDIDLHVGRNELKTLQHEVQNKGALRHSVIKRLAELVRDELSSKDPNFRSVVTHTSQLSEFSKQFSQILKLVDDRLADSKALLSKRKELQNIPQLIEKQQREIQTLRRQCDEAESRLAAASKESLNPSQQYASASRNLEQSKAALNATKSMYDAYVAEQQGNIGASPVVAEHERLQLGVVQAERALQSLAPEFERVKRIVDAAKTDAATCAQKLEDCLRSNGKLTEDRTRLESECRTLRDRLQWARSDYILAEQAYTSQLQDLNWLPESNQLKGVPELKQNPFATRTTISGNLDAKWELNELNSEVDRLDKFAKSLRLDHGLIRTSLVKQDAARLAALKQRSVMLLDPTIAEELTFE